MQRIKDFFQSEQAGGIVLMATALFGLLIANSGAATAYFALLNGKVLGMSVLHWINDALMAVFFLFVGLEVKRELLQGELSDNRKRFLPAIAALGGLVTPALVYCLFVGTAAPLSQGWAIPAATDIAFALGVLALLGNRVPVSLKIFLTALAIMDDLAVIVVIALFYTAQIQWLYVLPAIVSIAALFWLNRQNETRHWPYIILGLLLWFFVLKTGVHATLAGVILAFAIPLRHQTTQPEPMLLQWEHSLANTVAFVVLPIFGWANAGVSFANVGFGTLFSPLVLGIAAGLFIGKQLGIFATVWLLVKTGLAKLPEGASWKQVYGVALLCGIGFTMSLFISLLAFTDTALQDQAKIGVFIGSLLSGVAGFVLLRKQPMPPRSGSLNNYSSSEH